MLAVVRHVGRLIQYAAIDISYIGLQDINIFKYYFLPVRPIPVLFCGNTSTLGLHVNDTVYTRVVSANIYLM